MPHLPAFVARRLRDRARRRREEFPRLVSVELTSVCNAACVMCPHETMQRPLEHMPMAVFEKVLDDCAEGPPRQLNLFWFGDSLCNPAVLDYLRLARRRLPRTKLAISTNAALLHAERSEAILAEDLLDLINFDIDGATRETFEAVRVGLSFEQVMANTLGFIARRRALGKRRPETRATIIDMEPTHDEVAAFRAYWTGKVDRVVVSRYNTWLGARADLNVGEAAARSAAGSFTFPCLHPWDELVVAADGTAGLCCLDYDLSAPLGSVTRATIAEIWRGRVLQHYRGRHLALDTAAIACCRECNAHIFQERTGWAQLWRAAPHRTAPGREGEGEA